jgi:hypothetical protein
VRWNNLFRRTSTMNRPLSHFIGHWSILLGGLAMVPSPSAAQGLAQADVLPPLGDSWHMRALQSVPADPVLVHDMVWEYVSLHGNDLFGVTHTVVAPELVTGSGQYPETNRAVRSVQDDGSGTSHTFYQTLSDRCLELGTISAASTTIYDPGALAQAYPIVLGDQASGAFCYTVNSSSGSAGFCGTSTVELVTTGTLVLSFGTFADTRFVTTTRVSAPVDGGASSSTVIYDWYAPGIPYPMLHFTTFTNSTGGVTRTGQILDERSLVGIAEHSVRKPLPVFPNPTHGPLTVQSDGPGVLRITSADGRISRTIGIAAQGRSAVDLGDLPEGAYELSFLAKDAVRSARVVLMH